jgi:hypothetical protein
MEHMNTDTNTTKQIKFGRTTRRFAGVYEITMKVPGAYTSGEDANGTATIEKCERLSGWEETHYHGMWRVVVETANDVDGYTGYATEWVFSTKRDAEQYARTMVWAWGTGFGA